MRLSATELASLTLLAIAVVTLCVLLSLRSCAGKSASAPAPVPVLTDTAACPPDTVISLKNTKKTKKPKSPRPATHRKAPAPRDYTIPVSR